MVQSVQVLKRASGRTQSAGRDSRVITPPINYPDIILANSELHDESHLKVLRLIQANPNIGQREMAQAIGVSLGKVNFCLHALVGKGHVKVQNFRNNQNKLSYSYLLTPSGLAAKGALTVRFLKRKMVEYEELKAEYEAMQLDGDGSQVNAQP